MGDYRVTVKVRNAKLLRAINNAGYSSIPKFCVDAGVAYVQVNALINMVESPLTQKFEIRKVVNDIIDFLCEPFDALFSEAQCEALVSNKSERDVSAELAFSFIANRATIDPMDLLEGEDRSLIVDDLLKCLVPREENVIRKSFGIGCDKKTLKTITDDLGVNRERVRHIEAGAIRKMREKAKEGKGPANER